MLEDNTKYKVYFMEFLPYLKEDAIAAKTRYHDDKNNLFNAGYYCGYYKVMALIMEVTEGLDVELVEWGRSGEDKLMHKNDLEYKKYLIKLTPLLKEYALKAKEKYHNNKDNMFNSGYYCAFHGIMGLVMLLTIGPDLDLKELGLDNLDPDKDLIG